MDLPSGSLPKYFPVRRIQLLLGHPLAPRAGFQVFELSHAVFLEEAVWEQEQALKLPGGVPRGTQEAGVPRGRASATSAVGGLLVQHLRYSLGFEIALQHNVFSLYLHHCITWSNSL